MNIVETILGIAFMLIGGYGSWWLVSSIWIGITTSNLAMIIGVGILAYLLLSITLGMCLVGLVMMLEGMFE